MFLPLEDGPGRPSHRQGAFCQLLRHRGVLGGSAKNIPHGQGPPLHLSQQSSHQAAPRRGQEVQVLLYKCKIFKIGVL